MSSVYSRSLFGMYAFIFSFPFRTLVSGFEMIEIAGQMTVWQTSTSSLVLQYNSVPKPSLNLIVRELSIRNAFSCTSHSCSKPAPASDPPSQDHEPWSVEGPSSHEYSDVQSEHLGFVSLGFVDLSLNTIHADWYDSA
jgi:hypothetical protein